MHMSGPFVNTSFKIPYNFQDIHNYNVKLWILCVYFVTFITQNLRSVAW